MQPPLFCAVTRLFSIPCIAGPASHYGNVFYSTALYHTVFSEISVYQATRQLEQTEVLFSVLYHSEGHITVQYSSVQLYSTAVQCNAAQ